MTDLFAFWLRAFFLCLCLCLFVCLDDCGGDGELIAHLRPVYAHHLSGVKCVGVKCDG